MKKLMVLVISSLVSCSESDVSLEKKVEPQQVLKFDDRQSLLDYISNEQPENNQIGRISNIENFVSFNDIYLMAIKALNEVDDIGEQDSILNKYKDVLELKDSVIRPIVSLSAYGKICNSQRIYQTGDFVNKVMTDDHLITTHKNNYQQLLSINSIDNIDKNNFRVITLTTASSDIAGRTQASCGKEILVDYFKNSRRCKNDRRVWVHARVYFVYYGDDMYLPYSEIKVFGEKRNGLCIWSGYETTLSYRNVSFSVLSFALDNPNWGWTTPASALRIPFVVSVPNYFSTHDILAVEAFKGPTGAWLNIDNRSANTIIAQINPSYEFNQIRVEASSRGTDNNWAIINCQ